MVGGGFLGNNLGGLIGVVLVLGKKYSKIRVFGLYGRSDNRRGFTIYFFLLSNTSCLGRVGAREGEIVRGWSGVGVRLFAKIPYPQTYYNLESLDEESYGLRRVCGLWQLRRSVFCGKVCYT